MFVEICIRVKVFGGLDQLTRVINIARRGKISYRELKVKLQDGETHLEMDLAGKAEEVEWLMKKIIALPEVLSIEPVPKTIDMKDSLTEVFLP